MDLTDTHTLKARYVFPASGDPIRDGTVTIQGERIIAVGSVPAEGPVSDLGNMAILPGLVNAHVHLEFSDLAEPLGRAGMPFIEWIRLVVDRYRRTVPESDEPIRRGLSESVLAGTTTLGEIAQPGWPVDAFQNSPIDSTVFLELIAPTPERVAPIVEQAARHARADEVADHRLRPGLSPHAPYTVLPELLEEAVSLSAANRVPVAFHLAESREEMQLLRTQSGPFWDRFEQLGTCDPGSLPHGVGPLDYLRTLSGAHRALVIHGNYLDGREIAFLAERAARMAVVYCPRTHAYFEHDRYPLEEMLAAGVTVALGTDSRASSPDLSVLEEMRTVARSYPGVDRRTVLQLGTLRAAQALDLDREIGSLEPGKFANLAIVPLDDRHGANPYELLFNSNRPVVSTWYRGKTPEVWTV